MTVYSTEVVLDTEGEVQIIDITLQVRNAIKESGIKNGLVNVFNPGSTGSIITMEFEPHLVKDTITFIEKLVPKGIGYNHDFQDDNAHSHLRASMFSPEITIPIIEGKAVLGTWQQIVFLELDTRGRERKLVVTIVGDK
ncbi:MAG: YjbQ family protein [Asgard group archaeon]|nr:YjbQ family protein [Asgard group archaeon]